MTIQNFTISKTLLNINNLILRQLSVLKKLLMHRQIYGYNNSGKKNFIKLKLLLSKNANCPGNKI